jgi:hypothetical protein
VFFLATFKTTKKGKKYTKTITTACENESSEGRMRRNVRRLNKQNEKKALEKVGAKNES